MVAEENIVVKLQAFLWNLRQGEFENQTERAFEKFNIVVGKYNAARVYLLDEYLPGLYTEGRSGQQQLFFIANGTLEYPVSNLAHVVAEVLIKVCSEQSDDAVVGILLEIILQYEWYDLVGVEGGRVLRLEAHGMSFPLVMSSIRQNIRLSLLQLVLRKYVRLLVSEGPPSPQDLPSVIQRLDDVISLLLRFDDKTEAANRTALRPFLTACVSYTQQQSQELFGLDLGYIEYDEQLFEIYRVPLFPVMESDKLEFNGSKATFTNEGHGVLPPSSVRVEVSDERFGLGELVQSVPTDAVYELFVDEREAFFDFLHKQNLNLDVKVVFSFRKFGRSYHFGLLAKSVGHWLERIPNSIHDRSIPYEIPLAKMNDKEFERLCMWIVEEKPNGVEFEDVLWLNEEGGGERGRDVIATEISTDKKWVFQCKQVIQFGPSDIESELTTFAHHIEEDPSIKPDVYVLFISRSITDRTKSKGDELAAKIGMEIKYWPKSTIDRLVRIKPKVKDRFWAIVKAK